MTKIFNDPSEFCEDQLAGFADLYADRLWAVPGGVVALPSGEPQVAVVVGGGSGHYPAFAGLVGPGFATGAVVGNIFTSPSAAQVYSVAKAADQGRGVILTFGNYAGDNMNFGIAARRLREEGIDTRIVVVTDDVASATEEDKRRGIAGDFTVFKAMGAAAAAGLDLDGVERVGREANAATRTLGVAFSGCTMPGAEQPLFTVPEGHLGLGLGIHGEPGIRDEPLPSADQLAQTLVSALLSAAPEGSGTRVGVILNGLGTTKYEELFLLWGHVAPLLRAAGCELVDPEVGELVTSLDMGGCSLTLFWLTDELEKYWRADAYTPAYRKQAGPLAGLDTAARRGAAAEHAEQVPEAGAASRALAGQVLAGLRTVDRVLRLNEAELGAIDAVAGDGDHGRGMVKGASGALASVEALPEHAGAGWLLRTAGRSWAAKAGGTSGVLWGAALEAAGSVLDEDADAFDADDACAAVDAFTRAIQELGGAQPGDKTMLDALVPFTEKLRSAIGQGLTAAWEVSAATATSAAADTARLRPQVGRARPLAEKSLGTPDAGATSIALILSAVGREILGTGPDAAADTSAEDTTKKEKVEQ
ncbi:dihydroxyacetone kinase family protein [Arthrobacter sp. Sa2CUA1]|uniref:Dihydroxyacetone kinase family protein n=1 Tax=Arthrobacter gallicola TaxID=2762225 RepID=A0ABR8UTG7_9MICC|nr:dihydroxyacetone kinase family protein [Arthrobacter gallicola]MBD7995672.1 dihydroxyacetone kinase family protein [Arthrobacter gallicola]